MRAISVAFGINIHITSLVTIKDYLTDAQLATIYPGGTRGLPARLLSVRAGRGIEGTNQIQRVVIARYLTSA